MKYAETGIQILADAGPPARLRLALGYHMISTGEGNHKVWIWGTKGSYWWDQFVILCTVSFDDDRGVGRVVEAILGADVCDFHTRMVATSSNELLEDQAFSGRDPTEEEQEGFEPIFEMLSGVRPDANSTPGDPSSAPTAWLELVNDETDVAYGLNEACLSSYRGDGEGGLVYTSERFEPRLVGIQKIEWSERAVLPL